MNAEADKPDPRRALRRIAGTAGAAAVAAGAYRHWAAGVGGTTGDTEVTLLDARGGSWLTRRPLQGAVCYCTGGVRSAYLTVRLRQAGYARAANDDGGMWAYAAMEAPLAAGGE